MCQSADAIKLDPSEFRVGVKEVRGKIGTGKLKFWFKWKFKVIFKVVYFVL